MQPWNHIHKVQCYVYLVLTIAQIHLDMVLQMLFKQAFLMTLVCITWEMTFEIIIIMVLEIRKKDTRGNEKKWSSCSKNKIML
jgi:hypothetical protein